MVSSSSKTIDIVAITRSFLDVLCLILPMWVVISLILVFEIRNYGFAASDNLELEVFAATQSPEFVSLASAVNEPPARAQAPKRAVAKPVSTNARVALGSSLSGGSAPELYLKARDLFAVGRYVDAVTFANAALKKNKNLNLARVLIAQSYYRMGDARKAGAIFIKIRLTDLPNEAAVDYLLTMYSLRRYREVINAYGLISDSHPYKDVAKFYTGVSLLQYRLYSKAQKYIRNAQKIPPALKSQRRSILADINQYLRQESADQQEQSADVYSHQQIYAPPPPVYYSPYPTQPQGAPAAQTPPTKADAHASSSPAPPKPSSSFTITPTVNYQQKSNRKSYSGYKLVQTETKTPSANVNLVYKYSGKPRDFGAQPYFQISTNPSYTSSETITATSELTADEADPTAIINIATRAEKATYSIDQKHEISGFYPVSDPFDLKATYTVTQKSTGGTSGKSKTDGTKLTLNAILENGDFKLDSKYTMLNDEAKSKQTSKSSANAIDVDISSSGESSVIKGSASLVTNKPSNNGIKSMNTYGIDWSTDIEDLKINLQAKKTDNTPDSTISVASILNTNELRVSGSYNLNLGLALSGEFAYQQFNRVLVPTKDQRGSGSGTGRISKAKIKYSPLSFFSVSASYAVTERNLSIDDPVLAKVLRQNLWSQEVDSAIDVSLSYAF